ncbi:DeoR/GlpR family DNA-binding transcription regulator [Streptomyces sp. NPDC002790]|uniref:DeoR/GlpR family DNA-binding transcription regulator n=1 Tax=Streptomyces sp. NPDC002790 TaxID=3154431 RepID=UPI00331CA679
MAQDEVDTVRGSRQRAILKALQTSRQVDVNTLAERFGVSGMTIRRDLAELDHAGLLDRVHGGAVPRRAPAYGSRTTTMTLEKSRIARAVAELVEPGASVGIDTGTTCTAVATELAGRDDLTVITNSLHAAFELRDTRSRVLVLGGLMTPELTLTASTAAQERPQIHLDLLILGCGGLSVDHGITYFDPAEVEVRRTLLDLADRVVVAADHSKFGRKKAMALGDLSIIDVLVTDELPPAELRPALADVVVAP